VQKVLELEAELHALEQQLAEARRTAEEAVETERRRNRRDLVPVKQAVVLFDRRRATR
jgi:MerR family transcriptional regulator/heat shock protein HspR